MKTKVIARQRRHERIRKKVSGTPARPRLSIFRSLNNIYAQVIDDAKGQTLIAASSLDDEFKQSKKHKGNVETARKVGELLAAKATKVGIKQLVFDRGGYRYHGRVKALAEAAREGGLEF